MRPFTVGLCCWMISAGVAHAQNTVELAKKAQAVLKDRCFSCHGESGANEGGFNYALNRKRLVRELVVPGSADESKLLQRVIKGEMPPDGDKLPPDEIDTLKKWIEADAPAFGADVKRVFVSPIDMLVAMLKDLEKANDRDRPFYRYFTLTHLYNAGFEDNELESHRQGLSKLVNSLSWGREVRVPVAIDPTKTILRIDLRHYKWNENDAWLRVIAADPYRVTYSHAAAKSCYAMTKSELPHVRADWFVFAASRPPLYNLILGLPDKPDEMLKFEKERLGVDVARSLRDYGGVMRAGFFPSGVSKSIRLIERHGSSYGAYWKSYDFKPVDPKEKTPRRRNLKANPTGPGGPNDFEHDGGEMIFNLPNGLQAYMLTDAAGQQIAKGPTDVVVDKEAVKRGRDPEVVNGVSCMNCHWSGMLNKTDQIREHVLSQPAAYSKEVIEFVTAVYAPKADLNAKLTEDRQRFEAAVRQCGLTGLAKSEPVATLAFQFDEPLDLDLAAAEAGVTPDKLIAALRSNAVLGRELGSLPQGQPVPRDTFLQVFGTVVKELKVGTFLAALSIRPGNTIPPVQPTPTNTPAMQKQFTNGIGMSMVLIPAGEFMMGSDDADAIAAVKANAKNEQPQHRVQITNSFYMAAHETTQTQYEQIMGTNPSSFTASGTSSSKVSGQNTNRFPVEKVSWFDAVDFCIKLSLKENRTPCYRLTNIERSSGLIKSASVEMLNGEGYRLPTEAEWEYACRAKSTTPFHFGSRLNGEEANMDGSYPFGTTTKGPYKARTTAVGSYTANVFGLYDMHGNVWEWCQDPYDASYYAQQIERDPTGPASSAYRVLRGGSWSFDGRDARSANRNGRTPVNRNNDLGFRVVCVTGAKEVKPQEDGKKTAISLFDGKTLNGWEAIPSTSPQWIVRNGVLTNLPNSPSLSTMERFNDFDLHLEFKLPPKCNTGVFLRGRYEVSILDPAWRSMTGKMAPPEEQTGAIWGLIAPSKNVYKGTGNWNSMDVRLVGRVVTVRLNDTTIIDANPIPKVTVGAFDDKESESGPIVLQSHAVTGAEFRNITIKVLP